MSSYSLLWIGYSSEQSEAARNMLAAGLEHVVVEVVPKGRDALAILSQDPGKHLLVIIDLKTSDIELAALVTSVKQINPATEIIVLGAPTLAWSDLPLPKYYRPIVLSDPIGAETLISCVAKLQEMVEAKEYYAQLSRTIGDNVGMSRTSTEALLNLMDRQSSVGLISIRRDGFFSSYNSEAERLTGYSMDEAAHIQVWCQAVLTDYDSVKAFLADIEQFWARKTGTENRRVQIRRKDGRIVTLAMTVLVLLNNFGQARQLVALFFDPLETWGTREYQVLLEAGSFGLYTYLPSKGFIRMSKAALELFNRAFGMKLGLDDILNMRLDALPLPRDIVDPWQRFLDALAAAGPVPQEPLSPVGLPGRRIMEHAFISRIPTGIEEKFAVLAGVIPRDDLQARPVDDLSTRLLAQRILNSIPRPFVFLQAVRSDEDRILDFVCSAMNPAGAELLGLNMACQARLSIKEIFPDAATRAVILENACHVTETGHVREFEIQLTLRPEAIRPSLIRFWLGKVADGTALFLNDITERKEQEQKLKHYRHVFSHMDEAIIVTDLDGNITDWNPASERMFGYSKSEILGKDASILTQSGKGQQLDEGPGEVLREGDVWKGEYEFVRSDGSVGVAFSVFALLKDDQDVTYGTVGLSHDLTERKRLEQRLTAKSQELQDKNLALNTLLRHAEEERVRACEQVAADLTRRVAERAHRILEGKNNPQAVQNHAALLLQELISSPQSKEAERDSPGLRLSEKEREVAKLIRLGKTTEEIAFILEKSPDTIRLQRISIRKKLGLTQRDRNLVAYLRNTDLG